MRVCIYRWINRLTRTLNVDQGGLNSQNPPCLASLSDSKALSGHITGLKALLMPFQRDISQLPKDRTTSGPETPILKTTSSYNNSCRCSEQCFSQRKIGTLTSFSLLGTVRRASCSVKQTEECEHTAESHTTEPRLLPWQPCLQMATDLMGWSCPTL